MKRISLLLFSASLLCIIACNKKEQPIEVTSENMHQAIDKVVEVMIHDIFSPVVASRIFVYPDIAAYEIIAKNDPKPYIIGGGEIYKIGLPFAEKIELTRLHETFKDADTFFPEFSNEKWELISEEEHPKDEKHKYSFTYETWVRK